MKKNLLTLALTFMLITPFSYAEEAIDKSDEKNSENKMENEPSKKNTIKQKNLGGELYKKIIDSITEV